MSGDRGRMAFFLASALVLKTFQTTSFSIRIRWMLSLTKSSYIYNNNNNSCLESCCLSLSLLPRQLLPHTHHHTIVPRCWPGGDRRPGVLSPGSVGVGTPGRQAAARGGLWPWLVTFVFGVAVPRQSPLQTCGLKLPCVINPLHRFVFLS